MDLETGDRVQVNLAPFIGAADRCRDSILCTVLAVHEGRVQVRTEPPYRELVLWVASSWVEGRARKKCSGCSFRRRRATSFRRHLVGYSVRSAWRIVREKMLTEHPASLPTSGG